jgi:hypothetical protein
MRVRPRNHQSGYRDGRQASNIGAGVYGNGLDIGVYGQGHAGVEGFGSGEFSVGVYGRGTADNGYGVPGFAEGAGTGVFGQSSTGMGGLLPWRRRLHRHALAYFRRACEAERDHPRLRPK